MYVYACIGARLLYKNRKLVTDHTVFGYYTDRYGLEQVGAVIPSISTAAQPSARELAALEKAIKEYEIKAIFVGNTVNPSLSEQVANDSVIGLLEYWGVFIFIDGNDNL